MTDATLSVWHARTWRPGARPRRTSNLVARGAQCVLLGGTEVGLLIGAEDADVPIFNTTILHAQRAVELVLAPADR